MNNIAITYDFQKNIKSDVDLSSDFFTWCTGNWIKNYPKPDNYATWSNFDMVHEGIYERIKDLIQHNTDNSELSQKMSIFYNKVMDINNRNKIGLSEITQYINGKFANIHTNSEFISFIASLHESFVFSLGISSDMKDSNNNVLYIGQGGITLGNKDYYIEDTPDICKYRQYYIDYIKSVFMLLGFSLQESNDISKQIIKLETELAQAYKSETELQDPTSNYDKMSVSALSKTTKFDFNKFLNLYGYSATQEIVVSQMEPLIKACDVLLNYDLNVLKMYFTFQYITSYTNILNDELYNISFEFNKKFSGESEKDSLERRSIYTTRSIFTEYINKRYADIYVTDEMCDYASNMIKRLKTAFTIIIDIHQHWMSKSTKQKAINKLNAMKSKIGKPDKFDDISDIPVSEDLSLFQNMLNIEEYMFEFNKDKYYNKPVDKDEWFMSSYTVNAYYDPSNNEICIPGGIMNAPFFDIKQEDAYNYGALGAVIAHEMTHGFDIAGSQFDINGNMKEWWKPEEYTKFKELTKNTLENFDNKPISGTTLRSNGNLTINENIADYGGVKIAFTAFRMLLDSISKYKNYDKISKTAEYKKFFIGFANLWANYYTTESLENSVLNNCHSISYMRVNNTLNLFNHWYSTFDIKPGDNLYIEPSKRALVW